MDDNRNRAGMKAGIIGIICNIILASSKLVIGMMSGMVSVIADAINNTSDAVSSIVSLVGFKLASKPADEEHPFGHARYEYISGLVVSFLVLLAGVELLQSSFEKVLNPEEITYTWVMYLVLGLSIVVKLGMAIYNYSVGRRIRSETLLATGADSRNDVITTSVVLIAALVSMNTGINLDGVMGCLVALFIIWSGIGLVKDTIQPLLGTAPDEEKVKEIEQKILSYEGVLGTHDLMVHDYGPGRHFASVHVEMAAEQNVLECHELIDSIEQDFIINEGMHLVIHYDPIVTSDEAVGDIRGYLKKEAKEIWEKLTIHDLRIVPGEDNTNVIFDLVVPYGCPVEEAEVKRLLSEKLREDYPHHTAVIKVDHSFVSVS